MSNAEETKSKGSLVQRVFTRRNLVQAGLFGAAVVGIQAWQGRNSASGLAPPISGLTLDGATVSTAGAHLVHFWATWCGVCSAMAHNIEALESKPILRIAARSGTDAELRGWLAAKGEASDGVVNDPSGAIARAWGVNAYPTTFAVDSSGAIVSSTVGYATELGLRARLWWAT